MLSGIFAKLNYSQIKCLKRYAEFTDNKFHYPYEVSTRANTAHALYRRELLEYCTDNSVFDWASFRITEDGKNWLKNHNERNSK